MKQHAKSAIPYVAQNLLTLLSYEKGDVVTFMKIEY